MPKLQFPANHRSESYIRNANDLIEEKVTLGSRTADRVADTIGSWNFIIIQSVLLVLWIAVNGLAWIAAPIIMMSQNRQAQKDRIEAHNDYMVNQKAAEEIDLVLKQMSAQNQALLIIHELLETLEARIDKLAGPGQTNRLP